MNTTKRRYISSVPSFTFTSQRMISDLFHKTVVVLVFREVGIAVLQAFQHAGQAFPHADVGLRRAVQSPLFCCSHCRSSADPHLEVLGALRCCTERRINCILRYTQSYTFIQCSDTVGWVTGTASGL